ncbi:hypothetical protein [Deinococcus sp. YIM 77859]|uniref:hypothetical protein n=1 Tax=Deinococcus sp. YIM 77859 TaxID=1540221 RepID=UPI000A8C8383|nr:hypothetical protein [Deinococcus sp. YIM 77859]
MDRVTARLGAALAGLVLLSAPAALALPKYRLQAAQQLGHDRDDPLWQLSGRVMPCVTCHLRPQGGEGWNAFGESLRAGFRQHPGAKFGDVLYSVLTAEADADGDSYPDALEFYARTLPGDPNSRPQRPLADLQAEFERAGGLKQYAPPKGTAR